MLSVTTHCIPNSFRIYPFSLISSLFRGVNFSHDNFHLFIPLSYFECHLFSFFSLSLSSPYLILSVYIPCLLFQANFVELIACYFRYPSFLYLALVHSYSSQKTSYSFLSFFTSFHASSSPGVYTTDSLYFRRSSYLSPSNMVTPGKTNLLSLLHHLFHANPLNSIVIPCRLYLLSLFQGFLVPLYLEYSYPWQNINSLYSITYFTLIPLNPSSSLVVYTTYSSYFRHPSSPSPRSSSSPLSSSILHPLLQSQVPSCRGGNSR